MATDAQIMAEAVWRAEYTPAALKAFGNRVSARLGCTVYYKGDTKHLRGRHRSRNWALRSAYCTNRSYGTTNAKDKAGPGDALRACDVMISGDVLEKVCRGIDEAVRAGKLPELAEWFGTFNSRTVVGWFEGHASSSDSSHLTHLHLGVWTQFVELVAFFDRLFDAMMTYIDGGDDMSALAESQISNVYKAEFYGGPSCGRKVPTAAGESNSNVAKFDYSLTLLETILTAVKGEDDTATIVAAIRAEGDKTRAGLSDLVPAIVAGLVAEGIDVGIDTVEAALRRVLGGVDGASPPAQG